MKPHLSTSESEYLLRSEQVRYVKHNDVDLELWDQCVMNAINGNVYVSSWYLDVICNNWEALVLGNYDYIMPLFPIRNFGLFHFREPYFLPRSGVYSSSLVSQAVIMKFIASIPSRFLYSSFSLHEMQVFPNTRGSHPKCLYKLDLIENYNQLRSRFSVSFESNLIESKKNRNFVLPLSNTDEFISFVESISKNRSFSISKRKSNQLRRIVNFALRFDMGQVLAIYSGQNEICGVLFIIWHNKVANCVTAMFNEVGISKGAPVLLFDHFIKKNAGINKILEIFRTNLEPSFFKSFNCQQVYLPVKKLYGFRRITRIVSGEGGNI